ncbi:MAG TPA: hypothetical protein VHM31_12145 [Polyangia bacterium]|nr:hypothetical protein [Polyangia bacterium]
MPRPTPPTTFDWMQPHRAPARAKIDADRRAGMYRAEIEERAALLARLGHGRDDVRARLAANLSWDFPAARRPLTDADVDGILDRLFEKPKPATPARPPIKGASR